MKTVRNAATLEEILSLAERWSAPDAAWNTLLERAHCWGPAHEFGHALISGPRDRTIAGYGLCEVDWCRCYRDRCVVIEAAAMIVSRTLLRRAGHSGLASLERRSTDYLHHVDQQATRGKALLIERSIWPLPITASGLDKLARRRIGARNEMPLPGGKRK